LHLSLQAHKKAKTSIESNIIIKKMSGVINFMKIVVTDHRVKCQKTLFLVW
jgi:hypothetical protein